jgi:hypothetical protein
MAKCDCFLGNELNGSLNNRLKASSTRGIVWNEKSHCGKVLAFVPISGNVVGWLSGRTSS